MSRAYRLGINERRDASSRADCRSDPSQRRVARSAGNEPVTHLIRLGHHKHSLTWGKLAPATICRGQVPHRQAECRIDAFNDPHWPQ